MELSRCPSDHTTYLSQAVADNAVTLHLFKSPHCTTINAFPCGDHFHIGHTSKAGKEACIASQTDQSSTAMV